jgi:glycosyltransferase involved in cell wall biosynthesis
MSEPTELPPSELPPIATEPLSVVLVARNDAARLPEVLAAWVAQLNGLKRDYEIILVDDGSMDSTGGLATFLAARQPRIRVLIHPEPRGFGAAIRTGLAAAHHPLFFYTTCDPQYQPSDLPRLLARIDQVHLISGYRVIAPMPGWLRWLGRFYRAFLRILCGDTVEPLPGWLGWSGHFRRFLGRMLFGLRCQDVDCAFRLFRRSIFERIPIQSDGSFAQVEILAKANFLGCISCEEPVTHRPAEMSSAKLKSPRRQTVREALRLIRNPNFGPPILSTESPAEGVGQAVPDARMPSGTA